MSNFTKSDLSTDLFEKINSVNILSNDKKILSDYKTLCMLGRYFLTENRIKESLFYYSYALKLNRNSSNLFAIIGSLYHLIGDTKLANLYWSKAIQINPNIDIANKLSDKDIINLKRKSIRIYTLRI